MSETNNKEFRRVLMPGWVRDETEGKHRIYVRASLASRAPWQGFKLSLVGVIGPKGNGDCWGNCGQISDTIREYLNKGRIQFNVEDDWDRSMVERLLAVWDKWHMNDMRAGCPHQRESWYVKKEIITHYFTWGDRFNKLRKRVEMAEASTEEYFLYQTIYPKVQAVTTAIDRPRWESEEVKRLIELDWIKPDVPKTRTMLVSQVKFVQHPEGLLCKPCEVCGYKYGSAWIYEDVPEAELDWLRSLKERPCVWNNL